MADRPRRHAMRRPGKRTTVRLPHRLKQDMVRRMVDDDYGLRGKSRWICEAVEQLLGRTGWTDEMLGDYLLESDDTDVVTLTPHAVEIINRAIPAAIEEYPVLKGGAQSAIIRTAINARVMGFGELKFH
ncbi:MAG: hypothetical protein U9R74_18855 [Pseudomonadota bacterium]|nr:hypothetical protein [Pseudomonadota bacterium]